MKTHQLFTVKYCFILLLITSLILSSMLLLSRITRKISSKNTKYNLDSPRKEHKFVMVETNFDKSRYIQNFPLFRRNLKRTLTILLWTPWFGDAKWLTYDPFVHLECPMSCIFTNIKTEVTKADAVIFHAVDYVNGECPLPKYRRWDQVWIFHTAESPAHIKVTEKTHNGIFNWTSSYRRDSDIMTPYFYVEKLANRKTSVEDIAATKSAGIAWVASNCNDHAKRQRVVREIQKYIDVDTFGKCGKKSLSLDQTKTVLSKYRFYLAFENSLCRDYITEKFSHAVLRQNIPVVVGRERYKDLVPPNSYIAISDFPSVKEFVDHLKYLMKNNTAYNSYFEWTKEMELFEIYSRKCTICKALHDETRSPQVYTDLVGYMTDDECLKSKGTFMEQRTFPHSFTTKNKLQCCLDMGKNKL